MTNMDKMQGSNLITICIATFRRDNELALLLQSIGNLERRPTLDLSLIVVDNYGEGDAKMVCETFEASAGIAVNYCVERTRGISFARNRALSELPLETEFVAFLDDDEIVDKKWLAEMLKATERMRADVWNGPVFSSYLKGTPKWIVRGRFFDRPVRQDGEVRDRANTGNVLFRRSILEHVQPWFLPELALSGGEDTDYFLRVHRAGFRIVWVKNAVVTEIVSPDRATARWIFKKAFENSKASYALRISHDSSAKNKLVLYGKAIFRIFQSGLSIPRLILGLFGFEHFVRAILPMLWGLGGLAALSGGRGKLYEET